MIDELRKAISEIEKGTGKRPKRIEFEGAQFSVNFCGVEIWCDGSMAGYFLLKCGPTISEKDKWAYGSGPGTLAGNEDL